MSAPALLRGHIQSFYVTANGRRLGPYYARVWKQNGRRRRKYVPDYLLEQTRAACHNYRLRRKRQQEKRAELERILGNLSFLTRACRRAKRIEHLLPHEQDHVRRIQTEGIAAPGRPQIKRSRGFIGPFTKYWLQKHFPKPEAQSQEPSEPPTADCQPPTRRYWRLPHELPSWFTEELWQEMASRIPKDKTDH